MKQHCTISRPFCSWDPHSKTYLGETKRAGTPRAADMHVVTAASLLCLEALLFWA